MAKVVTASERMARARALIEKARKVPVPPGLEHRDVHYALQVKDLMRQARDLIKFISYSPSATPEVKREVEALFQEIDQAEKEILHKA